MSNTEYHTGKMIPMELEGDTFNDRAKNACDILGYEMRGHFEDDYVKLLRDDGYRYIYILGDTIYKLEDTKEDPYNDIANARRNADGSISYEVRFYNGGCSLDEAIDAACKRLDTVNE